MAAQGWNGKLSKSHAGKGFTLAYSAMSRADGINATRTISRKCT